MGSHTSMVSQKNMRVKNIAKSRGLFSFLGIVSNILLAYGKSYEHGFMKKLDGHKLCIKSRFD
ncbi:hypothetical protein BHE74_00043108 [Ensete ventricosum]|nr:hypothetical protein GW17_00060119 [Ensete ventricosum]RWW50615.1 hypothetical protein BHE74_00043108 [Ensete ventricosum]